MTLLRIQGESWVTLEVVAECYDCEVAWVEEVWRAGLIGSGRRIEGGVAVRAVMLERVADVVRLHRHQGVALELVAALLEPLED